MIANERLLFRRAGLVACIVLLLSPVFPLWSQVGALALLVSLVGLPHGALDPFVAKQRGVWTTVPGLISFGLFYLTLVAGVVGVWVLAPVFCLIAFLAISAWHFGGDWDKEYVRQRWLFGTVVVGLPALFHEKAVASIYSTLSGSQAVWIVQPQALIALVAAVGLLWSCLQAHSLTARTKRNFFDILILTAFAAILPPIVYFIIYFCTLHSPLHLRHVLDSCPREECQSAIAFAVGFTVLTIVLSLSIFLFLLPNTNVNEATLRIVFIGLAALTVPHLLLVDVLTVRRSAATA